MANLLLTSSRFRHPSRRSELSPFILFSSVSSGPKTGWSAAESNKGVAVTLYGLNFGALRGDSFVTCCDVSLTEDTDYAETWATAGANPFLQTVTFWLTSAMTNGAGTISITTTNSTSNAVPFTIRTGNIYFIDKDVVGPGTGTLTDPWDDPNSYVTGAVAGDTAYMRAGVYDQKYTGTHTIWIRSIDPAGTAGNPIVWAGYPGEVAVIDSNTNGDGSTWHTSFKIQVAYIELVNLGIDGYSTGVELGGDGCKATGLDAIACQHFGSGTGIIVTYASQNEVKGCTAHGATTANKLDHAIYASGDASRVKASTLAYNYIYDNSLAQGPMMVINHQGSRIPVDEYCKEHNIYGNIIDCSTYPSRGIGVFDMSWDSAEPGETQPDPAYVYNNILIRCGVDANFPAMYQNDGRARFYNNILYQTRGRAFFCINSGSTTVIDSEQINNIYDMDTGDYEVLTDGTQTTTNNCYFGDGAYTGACTDPINTDPLLTINPATMQFTMGALSDCIDAAATLGKVPTDIYGVSRPQGAAGDIGALEVEG